MLRQVIRIDEEACDGCGECVPACHEGAIEIIDGKARLVDDRFCDGLGDCLGECPQGAITLETRDAVAFDEAAVAARVSTRPFAPAPCACPGTAAQELEREPAPGRGSDRVTSQLGQWPVQLRLLNPAAPYLADSELLLCADCVPFAVPDFHADYLRERTVAVSCPKLDDLPEIATRLAAILAQARPRKVVVARMTVPCCGGLLEAARAARTRVGSDVPIEVHTLDPRGERVETSRL
ncbi:MAG TPA: 4Fe-4S binding protein [Candidatus Krumholzibacteria bacterium]|nr:4Fe-4S binding protein [Candidatus Krumholzibacteria bacterium]